MKEWLRRVRGAVGMGLTWAVGWGFVGGMIELILNIFPGLEVLHRIDMWPQTLAIPGFLGGLFFSVVLRIAAGRSRFDELSFPRFVALGAVGGLLLGLFALSLGAASAVDPLWLRAAVIFGPTTLLGTASASGTLALARMGEERQLLDSDADEGAVARSGGGGR